MDWHGWGMVIVSGLVTLGIRASFIVLPPETRIPAWLMGSLKYVAAAVLPALVVPDVLFRDAPAGELFSWYRIAAALIAMLVAWRTKSVFGTLGVGMGVLLLLKWWGPI